MTFSGFKFRITEVQRFEGFQGRTQGYYYEVFGHANAYDLGETRTVNRTIASGSKNLVLDLQAEVVSLGDHWSAETEGMGNQRRLTLTQCIQALGSASTKTVDDLPSHDGENPFTRGRDVGQRWQVKELAETTAATPVVQTAERTLKVKARPPTSVFIEIMWKSPIKTDLSIRSFMSMRFLGTTECRTMTT